MAVSVCDSETINIHNQPSETTKRLMRAVAAYVALDDRPAWYHPVVLWNIRKAFAGDPEAINLVIELYS